MSRVLSSGPGGGSRSVAVHPDGRSALVIGSFGEVLLRALDSGEPLAVLKGFSSWASPTALDAEGRRAASAQIRGEREEKVIRIWDLGTGEALVLGPTPEGDAQSALAFLPGDRLLSAGVSGLRVWNLTMETSEVIATGSVDDSSIAVFGDGRHVAWTTGERFRLTITDLEERSSRVLESFGTDLVTMAVDPTGTIVAAGGLDGNVRVGPVTGEAPHLLVGHEGWVRAVAISPDGRWIASAGDDRTVRLWPMPDLSRTPFHLLPHDELLETLRALTNLRLVEDETSSTGWKQDVGPFPGWERVPEW